MKPGPFPHSEFRCGTEDVIFHFTRLDYDAEPKLQIGDVLLARLVDDQTGQREMFLDKVSALVELDLAMRLATAQGVVLYLKEHGEHDIIPFIVIEVTPERVVLQDDNINTYFGHWTNVGGFHIERQIEQIH